MHIMGFVGVALGVGLVLAASVLSVWHDLVKHGSQAGPLLKEDGEWPARYRGSASGETYAIGDVRTSSRR